MTCGGTHQRERVEIAHQLARLGVAFIEAGFPITVTARDAATGRVSNTRTSFLTVVR